MVVDLHRYDGGNRLSSVHGVRSLVLAFARPRGIEAERDITKQNEQMLLGFRNAYVIDISLTNGGESFWSLAKRRLARFCGVPKHTFDQHLKETEFRFNYRNNNLYKELLNFLRKDPL